MAPLHIVTQFLCLKCRHQFVGTIEEFGLSHYDILHILAFQSACIGYLLHIEMRIARIEFLQCHLVIIGFGITQFGIALRHLCQFCLKTQNVLHFLLRRLLAKSKEFKHIDDVLLICLTNIGSGGIIVKIILLLTQDKSTLHNIQDILLRVFPVSTDIYSIELIACISGHLHLQSHQRLDILGCLYAVEHRHNRCHSVGISTILVGSELIQVT